MTTSTNQTPTSCSVVRPPDTQLDLATVESLRAVLAAAHLPGCLVVLDMEEVTFFDSSALSVVLEAEELLRDDGGALLLVHVADRVLLTLRLCGVAGWLVSRP